MCTQKKKKQEAGGKLSGSETTKQTNFDSLYNFVRFFSKLKKRGQNHNIFV